MRQFIDYTGKRIGNLIVLRRLEQNGETVSKWICKCDCGTICIKDRQGLSEKRKTYSCGCVKNKNNGEKRRKDLTGRVFGNLTVLCYSHSDKKRAVWKCKCACGNEVFIVGKYLLNGETKSCGCERVKLGKSKKKPILYGTRFGKLTVLYEIEQRRNKLIYYHCKCDCGNQLDVQANHLRQGDTKSCGCVKSFPQLEIADFFKKNNFQFQRQYKFDDCISRKNRRLPFDFAIFENKKLKYLLQFQGQQHFKNTFCSSENQYKEYIWHDIVKSDYCLKNNIKLVYITYKDDLNSKLEELL